MIRKKTKVAHPLLAGVRIECIEAFFEDACTDPHAILGVHEFTWSDRNGLVVRVFHPDATAAEIIVEGKSRVPAESIARGLFAAFLPGRGFPLNYQVCFHFTDGKSLTGDDPYRFMPTLNEEDLKLLAVGRHLQVYEKLGAHPRCIDGCEGVAFAVWAPNAKRVSLIGEFNGWDGRILPMRRLGSSGIWELFVPGIQQGMLYKFELKTQEGMLRPKTDPFAFAMELRPGTASQVCGLSTYQWEDAHWMEERKTRDLRSSPMAIYEVHLGSWQRIPDEGHRWLTYRELADRLIPHMRDHGFNYLELLPVAEHSFDPSWGYQVTGYYAPTSRYGSPDDFRFLVDSCHRAGIGVILDWVPAHFPRDDFSLRRFDGTALYEHDDPRLGEHKEWGTLVFNYGRHEVRNFLLSNALYWLDQFHIDGLRVDAVASMIYLDYNRKDGEWLPNRYGGKENIEALAFLREFNTEVYAHFPGAFTVAEESTAFGGVSRPVYLGGLGFGFKWNMGWMNDTLRYFQKDPIHRKYHHNDLTFSMLYAYTENFILPLSHDEVAQGKGSLYDKMPGDHWQRLANLRLLYSYMFSHPGKKLLFMGAEFGQGREWNVYHSLDWHEATEKGRSGLQRFVKDLIRFYSNEKALYAHEMEPGGFFWIDCNDATNGVIAYLRWGAGEDIIVVLNLTPVVRTRYRIGTPRPGRYREVLNSDANQYGGSGVGNGEYVTTRPEPMHGHPQCLELTLPPLAALFLKQG